MIGSGNFECLFCSGNKTIAGKFELLDRSIGGSNLVTKLATQSISFSFTSVNRAVSLVSSFFDSGIDFVSPNRKRDANDEVYVVVTVGDRTDDIAIVADNRVSETKVEIRVLLQTCNGFLRTITGDLGSQTLQCRIALFCTGNKDFQLELNG